MNANFEAKILMRIFAILPTQRDPFSKLEPNLSANELFIVTAVFGSVIRHIQHTCNLLC